MSDWTLAQHGDRLERVWGKTITESFPRYEEFWRTHVVPVTFRVLNPDNLFMRPSPPVDLRRLGTASYWIFYHLAGAHRLLDDPDFPTVGVLFDFYARLASVSSPDSMVLEFVQAVRVVTERYRGKPRGSRQDPFQGHPARRVLQDAHGNVDRYRNWLEHNAGMPLINGHLPRNPRKTRYDLATVADTLDLSTQEFEGRFVRARDQATGDLKAVERALDAIWAVALDDLATMEDRARYVHDQQPVEGDRRLAFDRRLVPATALELAESPRRVDPIASESAVYLDPTGRVRSIFDYLSNLPRPKE